MEVNRNNIHGYKVLYNDSNGREQVETTDAPTREISLRDLKKSTA